MLKPNNQGSEILTTFYVYFIIKKIKIETFNILEINIINTMNLLHKYYDFFTISRPNRSTDFNNCYSYSSIMELSISDGRLHHRTISVDNADFI